MISLILSVLQVIAILISGVSGALSVLVNFKDSNGNITTWGRRAVAIVAISASVALIAHILKSVEDDRSRQRQQAQAQLQIDQLQEALNKLTRTSQDVTRAQYPLEDATVSVWIDLPAHGQLMNAYLRETWEKAERFSQNNPAYNNNDPTKLFYGAYHDKDGSRMPTALNLYSGSPFLPQYDAHPEIAMFTSQASLGIELTIPRSSGVTERNVNPDLEIRAGRSIRQRTQGDILRADNRISLVLSLHGVPAQMELWKLRLPKKTWKSNGRIISLVDLAGARLDIPMSVGVPQSPAMNEAIRKLRSGAHLARIRFEMGAWGFELTGKDFEVTHDETGRAIYTYWFPSSHDQLFALAADL